MTIEQLPAPNDARVDLPPLAVPFITRKSGIARLTDLGGEFEEVEPA